jgi:hypothetical protein
MFLVPPPLSDNAEALMDRLINLLNLNNIVEPSKKRSKLQVEGADKKLKLSIEDVAENKKVSLLIKINNIKVVSK